MQEARAGHGATARASASCPCSPAPPRLAAPPPTPSRAWRRATEAPLLRDTARPRPLPPPAARGRRARDPAPAQNNPTPAGAGGDAIGGYTPADYITYSDAPEHALSHAVEVLVDAPLAACVALWGEWAGLVEFLDLIGKVGLDPDLPDMALLFCYYRWGESFVFSLCLGFHGCLKRRRRCRRRCCRLSPSFLRRLISLSLLPLSPHANVPAPRSPVRTSS